MFIKVEENHHDLRLKIAVQVVEYLLLVEFVCLFQTYVSTQQLESICWEESGEKFVSSHNDGSYAFWDASIGSKPIEEPSTPYGPFPCKAITKLLWRQDSQAPQLVYNIMNFLYLFLCHS